VISICFDASTITQLADFDAQGAGSKTMTSSSLFHSLTHSFMHMRDRRNQVSRHSSHEKDMLLVTHSLLMNE
jgi:hypothetical protein